ncbi:hypothetical protein AAGN61_26570, partial [Klebsiella pneumoniae]
GKAERLTWHKAWTMVSTGFSISYTSSELKGFISQKTNKEFSAKVKLVDKATGKLGFEFTQKSKK